MCIRDSDYIDALWLKFGQLMEGFQNVTLGGCHPDGRFAGNEVTVMGLRASRKMMLDQPLISYLSLIHISTPILRLTVTRFHT